MSSSTSADAFSARVAFSTAEHHDRGCEGSSGSIELGALTTSILAADLFSKTRWRRFASAPLSSHLPFCETDSHL